MKALYLTSEIKLRCAYCSALTKVEAKPYVARKSTVPVLQQAVAELYNPGFYERVLREAGWCKSENDAGRKRFYSC
jgi:hypothetical protein